MRYLVCGLPRCGSTVTMTMLAAAGISTVGRGPAFEHAITMPRALTVDALQALDGHALKVLDPQLRDPSLFRPGDVAIILLTRDAGEQTASQIKFMRWQGCPPLSRNGRRMLLSSVKRDTENAVRFVKGTGCPVLHLPFEYLIARPRRAAEFMSAFLDPWVSTDPAAMAAVVQRRTARCLPGMLEETLRA